MIDSNWGTVSPRFPVAVNSSFPALPQASCNGKVFDFIVCVLFLSVVLDQQFASSPYSSCFAIAVASLLTVFRCTSVNALLRCSGYPDGPAMPGQ